MNKELIKLNLDKISCGYKYQDIECIDFIGYSKSYLSWANIKDLIVWKNKSIIDIGCHHGYFSFKSEREGASSILGLDIKPENIKMCNTIKELTYSICQFQEWNDLQPLPYADVTLCLNVLHHLKDKEGFLKKIKSKEIIFEIDKEDIELVTKYFTSYLCKNSHRPSFHTGATPNRVILLVHNSKKPLIQYAESKIFLAGSSCSGKTTFALNYSKQFNIPYFDYDSLWVSLYGNKSIFHATKEEFNTFMDNFPKRFITGNTPYTPLFLNKVSNDIGIVFICCANKKEYLKRCYHAYGRDVTQGNNFRCIYFDFLYKYEEYGFKILGYYDTSTETYITKKELLQSMEWLEENLYVPERIAQCESVPLLELDQK